MYVILGPVARFLRLLVIVFDGVILLNFCTRRFSLLGDGIGVKGARFSCGRVKVID